MVLIIEKDATLRIAVNSEIIKCEDNGQISVQTLPKVNLPANITKGQEEILKNEVRMITSFCNSKNSDFYAVSTNNKQVVIYDKSFGVVRNFVINRTSSKLCFTTQNDLIVADKTGEVYLYKIHEEKDEGTWILGHNSMILDVLITDCGKYIITSDRDEKIRVSCFPNAYNIVTYCLGHEEFVTNIFAHGSVLLSASGDGTLRTWNYLEGKQLQVYNTNDHVKNEVAVKKFCASMDSENVDIKVLPITNFKTCVCTADNSVNVAVSVLNISLIQIFKLYESNLSFVTNVDVSSPLISYYLGDLLYVLTNDSFKQYNISSKSYLNSDALDKCYKAHKDMLNKPFCAADISILYKRKFDNVQEYLERKKLRLENKS